MRVASHIAKQDCVLNLHCDLSQGQIVFIKQTDIGMTCYALDYLWKCVNSVWFVTCIKGWEVPWHSSLHLLSWLFNVLPLFIYVHYFICFTMSHSVYWSEKLLWKVYRVEWMFLTNASWMLFPPTLLSLHILSVNLLPSPHSTSWASQSPTSNIH